MGSGIWKQTVPDPGSRGQKGTGSRIRIPDPDPQHCYHHQQIWPGWVIFLQLARRGALPARCSMYMSFLWVILLRLICFLGYTDGPLPPYSLSVRKDPDTE
jgi:hypothetical protein